MAFQVPDTMLSPPWKEAFERYADIAYGTLLTHEDLASVMDIEAGTVEYRAQVRKFRKRMLKDRNIALENVFGIGYRVALPREHAKLALREAKMGNRHYKSALDTTVHVDAGQLTSAEFAQHALAQTRIGAIYGATKREIVGLRKALAEKAKEPLQIPGVV